MPKLDVDWLVCWLGVYSKCHFSPRDVYVYQAMVLEEGDNLYIIFDVLFDSLGFLSVYTHIHNISHLAVEMPRLKALCEFIVTLIYMCLRARIRDRHNDSHPPPTQAGHCWHTLVSDSAFLIT